MTKVRGVLVAVVAACLFMGLAADPSAAQKKKQPSIAAVDRKAATAGRTATAARRAARTAQAKADKAAADLAGAAARLTSAEGSLVGVLTALPQLVAGITALSDAVQKQVVPGLRTLADGVQNQITPVLRTLADRHSADEFGIVQLAVPDDALTPDFDLAPDALPGCFAATGDLPDNAQSATLTVECVVPALAGADAPLVVLTGIRSNEVDGPPGNTDPARAAGAAGIATFVLRDDDGTLVGSGGTTTAAVVGPTVPILVRSPATSATETSYSFEPISTDLLTDIAATRFAPGGAKGKSLNTGDQVTLMLRFVDLTPASADPKE